MTDIEAKALALVNKVSDNKHTDARSIHEVYSAVALSTALCRALEQHEAFKQEVSDAVEEYFGEHLVAEDGGDTLASFIIPKPKPDPLVETLKNMDAVMERLEAFRAALEALEIEIREKGQ